MQTGYPTGAQLAAYAAGMGFSGAGVAQAVSITGAAQSAAAEWERRTGYYPFLAQTQTRGYDPPLDTNFVALDGGLLTLTGLTVGVFGANTGTALTQGTQFRLLPLNAPSRGVPYEVVEFLSSGYGASSMWPFGGFGGGYGGGVGYGLGATGTAGSVQVAGTWGRQAAPSDDVWRAVLSLGLLTALPELVTLMLQGAVSFAEDDVKQDYGPKPFAALESRLQANVDRVLDSGIYTRQPIYLG